MKFWISPLAATLALGATAASAEPFQGFHVGAGIGGSKIQSEDAIPGSPARPTTTRAAWPIAPSPATTCGCPNGW